MIETALTYLPWFSLLIAFGAMGIGAFAVIDPRLASVSFGIRSNESSDPYVRATGARDIFIGLAVLLIFLHGHFHLLGEVCVSIAVVSIVDALVTWFGGTRRHSLFHIGGTIAIVAYGLLLIFAF